jgi:hypothetical protein
MTSSNERTEPVFSWLRISFIHEKKVILNNVFKNYKRFTKPWTSGRFSVDSLSGDSLIAKIGFFYVSFYVSMMKRVPSNKKLQRFLSVRLI